MTLSTLGAVVAASLATAALAMTLTALVARRLGKVSVVDITWGLVFVAIGWVSFVVGAGSGRSLLLAALVTVWGGRLAWHIRTRALGAGEDPRYDTLLADAPPGKRFGLAVRKVFEVQGLAAWFVALPLQVMFAEAWPGVLTVLSPVLMTYILAFATGARLLESQMAKRPGYPEYVERTSMFIPRPPKRS